MDSSSNYITATRFDLGSTARVNTHFLSKQARKTAAARHVSGNSHGPTGFTARLFSEAPKTKTKNSDSQTKQNTPFPSALLSLPIAIMHVTYLSGREFRQG